MLATVCATLKDTLGSLPGEERNLVGIVTFDECVCVLVCLFVPVGWDARVCHTEGQVGQLAGGGAHPLGHSDI